MTAKQQLTEDEMFDRLLERRKERLGYSIITNTSKDRLETIVQSRLLDGWKLCGGVSIAYDVGLRQTIYAQAMIRE